VRVTRSAGEVVAAIAMAFAARSTSSPSARATPAATALAKTEVHTKEEADHSLPYLPYLLAIAALDRRVLPEQFTPERIARPDVQELLRRVRVRSDPVLSQRFPSELPCHVHVDRQDGSRISKWKRDYLGYPSRPMLYEDVLEKFRALTEGFVATERRRDIEVCVADLEHRNAEQLCELLEGDLLETGP
jgi:2-methylcitrate dehydratase